MASGLSGIKTLTIGSRGSHLALWQAHHVASRLNELGAVTRIEIIKTTGDHLQTASLVQAGGKGLFTKEIEEALLAGTIDLAVHSLKDLPTEMPIGLAIAAIPEREDARDAMVGARLDALREGARVGTSSGRRAAQLRSLRPDLQIEPVRGNVDTRLRKLKAGQYDDASAGVCAALNHKFTQQAVTCERAALAGLGGGCQLPIGAYAHVVEAQLEAIAMVISPDGRHRLKAQASGPREHPEDLGQAMAQDLLRRGADRILAGSS